MPPSIDLVSAPLDGTINVPQTIESKGNKGRYKTDNAVDQIEKMIAQYSNPNWPTIHGNPEPGTVVLLTGSTGNLGSHILETLLRDPKILRIYAFNRHSPRQPLDRHIERFENNGFDKSCLTSDKLIFVEGDTSQDNLGIDPSLFNEVCIMPPCFEM